VGHEAVELDLGLSTSGHALWYCPGQGVTPAEAMPYTLGLIGALVFFWQQADSFGQYLLAIIKALVWPAFLVYEVFQGPLG
jgi:hypothetical protein